MTPIEIGIIGIVLLVFLLLIRVPAGISLIIAAAVGSSLLTSVEIALMEISERIISIVQTHSLASIPFFTLMGILISKSNLSVYLYSFIALLSGKKQKAGFTAHLFSAALLLVAPISVAFVVFGFLTSGFVGHTLVSWIIPGILVIVLFAIVLPIAAYLRPGLMTESKVVQVSIRDAVKTVWIIPVLLFVVYGGLFFGWLRPAESAAAGATLVLIFAISSRQINLSGFFAALVQAAKSTARISLLIIGGSLFGFFMIRSLVISALSSAIASTDFSLIVTVAIFLLVVFIVGIAMDKMAALVIVTPIAYPILAGPLVSEAWLGVMIILILFVSHLLRQTDNDCLVGASKDNPYTVEIFPARLPLIAILMAICAFTMLFPIIATVLPRLMRGW